jgi:chorismate-pyruvate lyase
MPILPLWPDSADSPDVNVTMLLEQSVGEPVRAKVLYQECARFEPSRDPFARRRWPHATEQLSPIRPSRPVLWDPGELVLYREIVLQGVMTGRAHLHATSAIGIHRLEQAVSNGLLCSDVPLGRLLRQAHVAVTRTDLSWREYDREDVGVVFEHMPLVKRAIRRSYVMRGPGERAIAHITETFSASIMTTRLQDRGSLEPAASRHPEPHRALKH